MVELLSLPKPIKFKELVTDMNIASSYQLIWGRQTAFQWLLQLLPVQ